MGNNVKERKTRVKNQAEAKVRVHQNECHSTLRYHLVPVRVTVNTKIMREVEHVEKWKPLHITMCKLNDMVAEENSVLVLRMLEIKLPYDPAVPFPSACPEEL